MYPFNSYLFFLNIILLMLAVRHLRYLLLDPAINRYVGNITSWWNTKQCGRANNTDVHNSGSLYKKPRWFLTRKKITSAKLRVDTFCSIAQLDIFHVVQKLVDTFAHILCFFLEGPLSFAETSFCRNSFSKYWYFSLISHFCSLRCWPGWCKFDQAPRAQVDMHYIF